MDNLAHTLVGAALGESGLKRRTALAMPTLIIGANLPDVDVVALLFGDGLGFRRGWTHGVLAIAVLPLLLTAAMTAWDRWVRRRRRPSGPAASPRQLLLLSFLAVLTHPFLDWLNTYGMRWLMPFDGTWFYGDALFIVDPWLWLVLLGGIIWARDLAAPRAGKLAVTLAGFYIALNLVGTGAGTAMIREAMGDEGIRIDDVMVGPVPAIPFHRDVVMRRGENYLTGRLQWLPRPQLRVDGEVVRSNISDPAAQLAASYPEARAFLDWARFPVFKIDRLGRGYRVLIDDLRYSNGVDPSWAAVEIILRTPTQARGVLTAGEEDETGRLRGT